MPIPHNVDKALPSDLRRAGRLARRAFDAMLDVVFPPCCIACQVWLSTPSPHSFCSSCRDRIQLAQPPFCRGCGRPYLHDWQGDHPCGGCLLRPPAFSRARSWGCYPRESDAAHPLRQVIHRFKYGRQPSLGTILGRLMAEACQPWFHGPGFDVVVPVPLHPRRLRWRGFNQSVLLGREVGRAWGIHLDPFVLIRKTETAPQSTLNLRERQPNVRGAFAIARARSVEDRRVLVVDDVYTSGATVNECARALRRGGARDVQVLTLARTVS